MMKANTNAATATAAMNAREAAEVEGVERRRGRQVERGGESHQRVRLHRSSSSASRSANSAWKARSRMRIRSSTLW